MFIKHEAYIEIKRMGKSLIWRLSENQNMKPLIYDLSAILIHKGATVNSGHYVAHIKDEKNGIWWEFDDEQVSKFEFHPFGESSSTMRYKVGSLVKDLDTKSSTLNGVVEGSLVDQQVLLEATKTNIPTTFFFYGCIYVDDSKRKLIEDVNICKLLALEAEPMAIDGNEVSCINFPSLPKHLC